MLKQHKNYWSNQLIRDKLFWLALLLAPLVLLLFTTVFNLNYPDQVTWNLQIIFLLILAHPVLEEIIFRGLLQTFLRRKTFLTKTLIGISGANIITSIIFASLHLFYQMPNWAPVVFIPSLVFGFFYERYRSIFPGIVLHSFYNSIFLISSFMFY